MPVPSTISELSVTAASNSPSGSDSPSVIDDHLRAHASFLAYLRDGKQFKTEATVASAATTDIGLQTSLYVHITGSTTITSFGTDYQGPRFLRFSGSLTLTHNATSLILPGGANIVTQAGDTAIAVPYASGWRVVSYQRADGTLFSNASFASSSGTSGYQRLPSGIIVQWGSVAVLSASADTTITFPLAFPNACRSFLISHGYTAGTGSIAYCTGSQISTTQAVARSSVSSLGANWMAVGL